MKDGTRQMFQRGGPAYVGSKGDIEKRDSNVCLERTCSAALKDGECVVGGKTV